MANQWRRRDFLLSGAFGAAAARGQTSGFRFAIIGDRTGSAFPQIYSRVWREVNLFGPDFAVTIGDTIEGGKDATVEQEWRQMDAVWRRYRKCPTYYVAGNHDIWSEKSKQVFEAEVKHPATHSFVHGGALFVILDNSRTEELAPEQMQYLETALERHKALQPKFVFFHKPFWIVNARVGNRNFPLHQLVKRYGVDYVISGHGHQLVHLEMDGVRYLEIGSSGGTIQRGLQLGQGFKDGWFYHWMWVQVRDGKAEITVKEVTGPARTFPLGEWGPAGPLFDAGDPALADQPRL
jgi:predicted phosphodiesterase